jgi:hypothetical protein
MPASKKPSVAREENQHWRREVKRYPMVLVVVGATVRGERKWLMVCVVMCWNVRGKLDDGEEEGGG